jgi:hypothetical protein
MNKISTGAFQTEMDASNKQPTLAEKFAAVWEKKNAKAVRAGGVSLMALSLAACGSSDDDAAATDTAATDTTTTTPVVPVVPVVPTAVSKTFTINLDTLEGGAGADSFSGVYYADGGTGTTAFPGDSVDGGEGSDTLYISVAGLSTVAQNVNAIRSTGVEKLLITNFDTNADDTEDTTVDTSLMSGLTSMGMNASSATGDTIFSNIASIVDASMANGAADLTMTYIASIVAGAADTQTLAVSNVSAGTFTANGAETIAITTSTVKSTLTDVTSNTMTKLTIAGDQALTLSTALTAKTIDASASTGSVTLSLGTADQTVTGGSGADSIDTVATLTSADTISGGLGSDTLKVTAAGTINVGTAAAKGELYNVSGFETIDMSSTNNAATLNLKTTSGVTSVLAADNTALFGVAGSTETNGDTVAFTLNGTSLTSGARGAGATVDTFEEIVATTVDALAGFSATAGTNTVTITADSGEAVEFALGAVTGTGTVANTGTTGYENVSFTNITDQSVDIFSADAVTASLVDASGASDSLSVNLKTLAADSTFAKSVGTITANNIETINMDASGMGNGKATTVASLTGNSIGTLNLTGDSDVTFTAFTSSTKLANIDASASTGDISLATAPVAVGGSTIKTGGGNDTITMGATLTAADVIDAGGNNIPLNGTLMGSDTVTATGNIGTITASSGLQIANAESITLTIGAAAATYLAMGKVTGTTTFAVSNDTNGGTVQMTNLGAHHTVGVGIGTTEYGASATATLDLALADATGTADSISLNYSDTVNAASLQTLKIANTVETLNISAPKIAQDVTLTNTNMAAKNVVVTDGIAGGLVAMGTLNLATTNVDASAYLGELNVTTAAAGAVTVSAHGAATNPHDITTGGGNDTITLAGLTAAAANAIDGGAGTGDTLGLSITNAATDFTNVSNIETINLTVGANTQAGFNNGTKDNGLNLATVVNVLGGDSLSTFTLATGVLDDDAAGTTMTFDASTFGGAIDVAVASDAFDTELTIKGGASTTDIVKIIVAGVDNKVAAMSGVETLQITSTNSDTAAKADVTNVTGLTTINAMFDNAAGADQISIAGITAGTKIKTTQTQTADNLVLALTDATGSDDTLTVEITAVQTGGDILNFDAAGIETVAFTQKDTGASLDIDVAGLTATGTNVSTITVAGAGATVFNGINATTDTIDASLATGALTVGAAERGTDAKTIKGGTANDSIAMENKGDVLDGGLGTDSLDIDFVGIIGGITIDLTAADQVTNMDGSANAAVQSGFENVDVAGYTNFGASIVATVGANSIIGTGSIDSITAGGGADTIQAGVGNDQITLTETTSAVDTIKIATADAGDTIIGFTAATDILDLSVTLKDDDNGARNAAGFGASNALAAANFHTLNNTDHNAATGFVASTDAVLEIGSGVATVGAVTAAGFHTAFDTVLDVKTANDQGIFVYIAYDGTGTDADAGIFLVNFGTATGGTKALEAGDSVTLLAHLVDVGADAITAADII